MTFHRIAPASLQCAGADIPQNRFVSAGSEGIALTVAGEDAIGVSLEAYVDADFDNDLASNVIGVAMYNGGICEVEAGEALATVGVEVTSDGTGRVVAAGADDHVLGILRSTVGAAGEFAEVILVKAAGAVPAA